MCTEDFFYTRSMVGDCGNNNKDASVPKTLLKMLEIATRDAECLKLAALQAFWIRLVENRD